ncbi:MAG: thiamine phosphate synthase [Magnetospirillum sp.]|nr:thiamine phosphate synthase [Magnetospirillum sp.]
MTLANASCRLNPWPGPRLFLVTDEVRLPDPRCAMTRLPPGTGVLLRAYIRGKDDDMARAVARLARRRRLVLVVAGDWRLAARLGADGLHLPEAMARHGVLAPALGWVRRCRRLLLVACHGDNALGRARTLGADAALLSPVFTTRSHPGAPTLGVLRFGLMARRAGLPVIALGGLDRRSRRRLPPGSAAGLAAISGLTTP